MSSGLTRWTDAWATAKVPDGVDYPHVLRTPEANPFTSVLGVTLGLLSFMVATPLVMQGLAGLYWLALGSPEGYADTYRALVAYELPFGLVVGHLGLALLIPISWGLVLFVHRVPPGYLSSVAGRLRWRWFWISLAVGFATLWALLLVQNVIVPGGATGAAFAPQEGAVWFVIVLLLTVPLQSAAEEFFFRGYMMQALGALVASPWFGIVTSAAVFTFFHQSADPALVADRFVFGVLAGWLVVRTGGLEAAIAAHVANNLTAFTVAALTSSVAQVKAISEVTWAVAGWNIGRFALFTVLIWLLARGYQPQRTTRRANKRAPV